MQVYGFKAHVYKDGDWFVGEIAELHIHDQAKTLRELEDELKDAVDTAITFSLGHKKGREYKALRSLLARS
jgi:predicted RNase H-like HicB family nuclease